MKDTFLVPVVKSMQTSSVIRKVEYKGQSDVKDTTFLVPVTKIVEIFLGYKVYRI